MKIDFLLNSKTAVCLYDYVKSLGIIDYHNHLSLTDLEENKRYFDVYDLWIKPDPYKHRAMRMCGVSEKYITGDASDFEKFKKWCEIVPCLLGNPLYQWTKMELETVFGITEMPNEANAEKIYSLCNLYLENNFVSAESFLEQFRVEYVSPCMSVTDNIEIFKDNSKICPSLRGDDITSPTDSFVKKLQDLTGIEIKGLKEFENAIEKRLETFMKCGCRFSDHALDNGFTYYTDDGKNEERFLYLLRDKANEEDKLKLFSYILTYLAKQYAKYGIVMQLHIGAQRYTSTKLRTVAGAAGGYAGIGNSVSVKELVKFLDTVDCGEYGLPKTILFTLNPADNALISVLSGSYSKGGVRGLVTQGPAWWWCDHKQGIVEMLENTASYSVLSNFVGMTTDSRSFLSFVRHDYFRRILCGFLGEKFEKGDLCCTFDDLKNTAYKMCYKNAKDLTGGKNDEI